MKARRPALSVLLALPLCVQADCLKEGQRFTVEGRISRETFPGPPNYQSVAEGDRPETTWILTVATPNCVVGESKEDGREYEVAESTTRFQLVFADAKEFQRHASVVDQRARVSGRIFVGLTGHYHTEAAITVDEIEAVGAQ